MHGIAYNPVSDEIVVGNPLAAAVLVFRGAASGNEAPIRVIQGPRTKLVFPHSVVLDVKNEEILVLDQNARSVFVFAGNANGDVAPLRIIHGPKTMLERVISAAVDTDRNLIVVSSTGPRQPGLYIFNRTDSGDIAPQAVIAGPKSGIANDPRQLQVHQDKIYVAVENGFNRPHKYTDIAPPPGIDPNTQIVSPWRTDRVGFIGIWKITDRGDVPPLAVIKGPASGLIHPGGIALNPNKNEIYVAESVRNGLLTFLVPEFFGEKK